jgi:hypothetical protein
MWIWLDATRLLFWSAGMGVHAVGDVVLSTAAKQPTCQDVSNPPLRLHGVKTPQQL